MKIDPSAQRMLYTAQSTATQRRRQAADTSAPARSEVSVPAADTVTFSQEARQAAEELAAQKAASAASADMPKEEEAPEEEVKFLSATEAAQSKTQARKLAKKESMAKALQQAQNEYKMLCDQLERAKDSSGELEGYKNLAKALKIASLIMRGHRVSAADRQFMAENFPEILAKAEMMKIHNKDPKDYDVTGEEEEEESEDAANESGIAESASISSAGLGSGSAGGAEGGGETTA